jgi:hypothetical protein
MYRTRSIIFNAVTFVPGVTAIPAVKDYLARRERGTGGTISARYCYSVWLRHLVKAAESGLDTRPQVIAELGPGDSLGTGIAALLSGASKYYALDIISHATAERNIQVLHELAELFGQRAGIPDEAEFSDVFPKLKDYRFPEQLIANRATNISDTRIREIEAALLDASQASAVQFRAPWLDTTVIDDGTIDMLFSQAVLQSVDELSEAYYAMRRWLKPGGFMSHTVDFTSVGRAREWNGHWCYSDLKWTLIRGKQSWFLNREPLSAHIRLLHKEGFRMIREEPQTLPSTLKPQQLARRFKNLTLADLTTSGVFFQAAKQH